MNIGQVASVTENNINGLPLVLSSVIRVTKVLPFEGGGLSLVDNPRSGCQGNWSHVFTTMSYVMST